MITVSQIKSHVAEHFGISIRKLDGPSRRSLYAKPRMLAMAMCREYTDLSLIDIGNRFNRDHTTVIHAVKWLAGSQYYQAEADEILERIKYNEKKPGNIRSGASSIECGCSSA